MNGHPESDVEAKPIKSRNTDRSAALAAQKELTAQLEAKASELFAEFRPSLVEMLRRQERDPEVKATFGGFEAGWKRSRAPKLLVKTEIQKVATGLERYVELQVVPDFLGGPNGRRSVSARIRVWTRPQHRGYGWWTDARKDFNISASEPHDLADSIAGHFARLVTEAKADEVIRY